MFQRIVRSPWFQMVSGAVLLFAGAIELLETSEFVKSEIELHHGMIVTGFMQALRGLVEGLEGAAKLTEEV